MEQRIIRPAGDCRELDAWIRETGAGSLLLVCGASIRRLRLGAYFDSLEARTGVRACDISTNCYIKVELCRNYNVICPKKSEKIS